MVLRRRYRVSNDWKSNRRDSDRGDGHCSSGSFSYNICFHLDAAAQSPNENQNKQGYYYEDSPKPFTLHSELLKRYRRYP